MNIILIGIMGSGKSTTGRKLAQRLNMAFFDMDREIEKVTQLSMEQLYRKYGKVRFCAEENLMLQKLLCQENAVLSTSGTLEINDAILAQMKKKGLTIVLWAQPQVICQRIKRRNHQPILEKKILCQQIEEICQKRKDIYQKADFLIDVTDISMDEVLKRIEQYLRSVDKKEINARNQCKE